MQELHIGVSKLVLIEETQLDNVLVSLSSMLMKVFS